MTRAEELRRIAEISAQYPIPPDKTYPVDHEEAERTEAAAVETWVQKSMHEPEIIQPEKLSDGTYPNDVVSRVALINTINDEREHTMKTVVEPLVREMDDLKRENGELRAREKQSNDRHRLTEDRLRAIEERYARLEARVAKVEDRAFSSASGLSSYAGNTAH